MDITDIRIFIPNVRDKRLLAFANVTFDSQLVVKEIRILDGRDGWYISLPARKKNYRCPNCGLCKNHMIAKHCNECGVLLPQQDKIAEYEATDNDGLSRKRGLYEDICHPINTEFRAFLQNAVLDAYEEEIGRISHVNKVPLPQVQETVGTENKGASQVETNE